MKKLTILLTATVVFLGIAILGREMIALPEKEDVAVAKNIQLAAVGDVPCVGCIDRPGVQEKASSWLSGKGPLVGVIAGSLGLAYLRRG